MLFSIFFLPLVHFNARLYSLFLSFFLSFSFSPTQLSIPETAVQTIQHDLELALEHARVSPVSSVPSSSSTPTHSASVATLEAPRALSLPLMDFRGARTLLCHASRAVVACESGDLGRHLKASFLSSTFTGINHHVISLLPLSILFRLLFLLRLIQYIACAPHFFPFSTLKSIVPLLVPIVAIVRHVPKSHLMHCLLRKKLMPPHFKLLFFISAVDNACELAQPSGLVRAVHVRFTVTRRAWSLIRYT